MPFSILQVNFHTSNDFCDWRLLNSSYVASYLLDCSWSRDLYGNVDIFIAGIKKFFSGVSIKQSEN